LFSQPAKGKKGRGHLADYEKTQATLTLFSQLGEGEQSAQEHGWLTPAEVKRALRL